MYDLYVSMKNFDKRVTASFGHEWATFTQGEADLPASEREQLFREYFRVFPWKEISADAVGLDAGCGSGRWGIQVAPRVNRLHMLDASSEALATARKNLSRTTNVTFHHASVSEIPLPDDSLDFAYSLGVLHHVPDTVGAMKHIRSKLKPGAPFLVYLYYALDSRPRWFRSIWKVTDIARRAISRLPASFRLFASQMIAASVYWPIARLCSVLASLGVSTSSIPLEAYKDRSFYTMRTDAYDRFCTALEKRFTKKEIEAMLLNAGFERVVFSDQIPFWCALAYRPK